VLQVGFMSKEKQLGTMLRARVTGEQKRQLEAIAAIRQMSVSCEVREANRGYLAMHYAVPTRPFPPQNPEPELAGV
jgi:hypothetical protein